MYIFALADLCPLLKSGIEGYIFKSVLFAKLFKNLLFMLCFGLFLFCLSVLFPGSGVGESVGKQRYPTYSIFIH
jgi:hypothetical protein